MMKGREGKSLAQAAPSADLLVCFPSRAHLTLMPKPICSPARPAEPNKRHHRRKKSLSRGGVGQSSPLLWTKTKSMGSEITEPTSPKVTCAGQIKVRPKTTTCRSWQSVMEEIEKIHTDKKQRKRVSWAETLGFKKEIMQFLTCLRSIRFDLRCFGSFSGTDIATEEDEEDEEEDNVGVEEEEEEHHVGVEESDKNDASRAVFSKWFMVLQENQNNKESEDRGNGNSNEEETVSVSVSVPPPNALLLMRCRSAPAKSWLREREGGDDDEAEEREREKEKEKEKGEKKGQSLKWLMDEEKRKKEDVVVMRYDSEFYDISSDVVKETWIVGGIRDLMSRSRSSKR